MATINDFGIPDIGNGILHPKQKHRWRAKFINLGTGASAKPLSHQLVTFKRPSLNFDKVTLDRYNSRSFIAGKHTIEPVDFVLEDDVGGTATALLQDQLQKQQWLIGAEGPWLGQATEASEYKFGVKLEMLNGGKTEVEVLERITCEGCWLENVDYGDLDYGSSDVLQITVTMSIDHFRQELLSYTGQNSALGGRA